MAIIDVYTLEGLRDRNIISLIIYNKTFNVLTSKQQNRINKLFKDQKY